MLPSAGQVWADFFFSCLQTWKVLNIGNTQTVCNQDVKCYWMAGRWFIYLFFQVNEFSVAVTQESFVTFYQFELSDIGLCRRLCHAPLPHWFYSVSLCSNVSKWTVKIFFFNVTLGLRTLKCSTSLCFCYLSVIEDYRTMMCWNVCRFKVSEGPRAQVGRNIQVGFFLNIFFTWFMLDLYPTENKPAQAVSSSLNRNLK